MVAEPPFEPGALQARATLPFPPVAELRPGAPGTVTGADGVAERSFESTPSPTAFTPETL